MGGKLLLRLTCVVGLSCIRGAEEEFGMRGDEEDEFGQASTSRRSCLVLSE